MPRYSTWDDDDDERDWAADDADDPAIEGDEDGDEPTFPCPACRRLIHEEAQACPHCGEYLAGDEVYAHAGRPWWVWAGAFAALFAMLFGILVMVLSLIG